MSQVKLSILVFAKNCVFDIEPTLDSIVQSIEAINFRESFEVILVDDNSTDDTTLRAIQYSKTQVRCLRLTGITGINNAIFKAIDESSGEFLLPIPGHNMFDSNSIAKVLELLGTSSIVIGCREELWESRPFAKFLGSKLLLTAYQLLLYSQIKDVHGLILYERSFLRGLDRRLFGHGFHMYPLTMANKQQMSISQVPIVVQPNHKKRFGRNWRENFPTPKAICEILKQFASCLRVKYSKL